MESKKTSTWVEEQSFTHVRARLQPLPGSEACCLTGLTIAVASQRDAQKQHRRPQELCFYQNRVRSWGVGVRHPFENMTGSCLPRDCFTKTGHQRRQTNMKSGVGQPTHHPWETLAVRDKCARVHSQRKSEWACHLWWGLLGRSRCSQQLPVWALEDKPHTPGITFSGQMCPLSDTQQEYADLLDS